MFELLRIMRITSNIYGTEKLSYEFLTKNIKAELFKKKIG